MNYHIGRDGRQLGSFSLEQVMDGLANGTLLRTDLAWSEGMADWQPLDSVLAQTGSMPAPPALPVRGPVLAPPSFEGSPRTEWLATLSLVLGMLSFALWLLTAIPAIVCGHLALGRIKRSDGTLSGRGLAIAGLVLGYSMIMMLPILAGLAVPVFMGVQQKAQQMQSVNNLRQVVIVLKTYASDHNGKYPATLEPLVKDGSLADPKLLQYPPFKGWSPETGYEYLGAQLTDASPGNPVLLRSRSHGPRGQRIIAHNDGSVSIETPASGP